MSNIAFLGMGAMGSRIASRLLTAGHSLQVWNRTSERCQPLVEQGAIAHDSPRQAAQTAEVVIAMVADDKASRQVWLEETTGAMGGLNKDAIAIEYSTLTPDWSHQLAQTMDKLNHSFLAAPVIGSRPQAEAGQLIQLLGGKASTATSVQTLL